MENKDDTEEIFTKCDPKDAQLEPILAHFEQLRRMH